jgi:ribosomal protein S21
MRKHRDEQHLQVFVSSGEQGMERAIRLLRKKMANAGTFRKLKERRLCETRSQKVARKKRMAINRKRASARKQSRGRYGN